MVIFLIAMIGIVLFVLFSLNTPSVNFKKGNLFNTSVFYNNSFWIVFIILSLIAIFNFGTDDASLDANNNVATSKSAATNNQIQQEMDKEKIRANSYKLNIEQVKTECRLETQMFYAALNYRFQMHNNVNDNDVEKRAIDAARATLNPTNANMDGIKMWANMASSFASQASYEGMIRILANGTSDNEKKCVDSNILIWGDEGYYYYPKNSTIVNWDNTSNTDWQITCTPQEPCQK